jgi:carbon storage regulator
MLVLSRKPLEKILIGRDIRITVVKVERNQVRLGIEAPPGVCILRSELSSEHSVATRDQLSDASSRAQLGVRLASRSRSGEERRSPVEY